MNDRFQVKEIAGFRNEMFLLEENKHFSLTQYKVLQNITGKRYLRCAKSVYNGKIKLVYFTENKKTLKALVPVMRTEELLSVIREILKTLCDTKDNGFLDIRNLELSDSKIYIDPESMDVKMIYLPLDYAETDQAGLEQRLKALLIGLFSDALKIPENLSVSICGGLMNSSHTVDEMIHFVEEEIRMHGTSGVRDSSKTPESTHILDEEQSELTLVCTDPGISCVFNIFKKEFVIGKKADAVDGRVDFNSAVSRVHCRIIWLGDAHYIMDLKSANGTFINGERLVPQKAYRITDGDIIRLANSEFIARIN